jgi:hypothetical protein
LLFRAARTQRCAGEEELVSGLTKHGALLAKGGLACQQDFSDFAASAG